MEIALIIGIVVGLTQLFKSINLVPKKYLPLLSLGLGIVFAVFVGDGSLKDNIVLGVMVGLSASGLFDQTKNVTKKGDKK